MPNVVSVFAVFVFVLSVLPCTCQRNCFLCRVDEVELRLILTAFVTILDLDLSAATNRFSIPPPWGGKKRHNINQHSFLIAMFYSSSFSELHLREFSFVLSRIFLLSWSCLLQTLCSTFACSYPPTPKGLVGLRVVVVFNLSFLFIYSHKIACRATQSKSL